MTGKHSITSSIEIRMAYPLSPPSFFNNNKIFITYVLKGLLPLNIAEKRILSTFLLRNLKWTLSIYSVEI